MNMRIAVLAVALFLLVGSAAADLVQVNITATFTAAQLGPLPSNCLGCTETLDISFQYDPMSTLPTVNNFSITSAGFLGDTFATLGMGIDYHYFLNIPSNISLGHDQRDEVDVWFSGFQNSQTTPIGNVQSVFLWACYTAACMSAYGLDHPDCCGRWTRLWILASHIRNYRNPCS